MQKTKIKAACIQMKAAPLREFASTGERTCDLLKQAAEGGCDLAVLPECAYPAYCLGIDGKMLETAMDQQESLLTKIGEICRQYKIMAALGIPLKENGKLYNGGILLGTDGRELGRCHKSNLWHYDRSWFEPGHTYQVCDTEFGKIGLMVCADGRIPEIAGILKRQGAGIIIDFVNLCANAKKEEELSNQQYEFMLPVRALENGVWLIVSDKCGMEDNFVSNLGRSMIIDPMGRIVAEGSSQWEEIIWHEIDLKAPTGKLPRRRPQEYGILTCPTENLPIKRYIDKPVRSKDLESYCAVSVFEAETRETYVEKALADIFRANITMSDLVALPMLPAGTDCRETAEELRTAMDYEGVVMIGGTVFEGGEIRKIAAAFDKNGILRQWSKEDSGILEMSWGNMAVVFGDEMYIPEPARCRMLMGCDILCWYDEESRNDDTKVLRTRAAENKIFVIRSVPRKDGDGAMIGGPDGRLICSGFLGREQLAGTAIYTGLSRSKMVVPGTDIIDHRLPWSYKILTEL